SCPAPDGCNGCTCYEGQWECTLMECGDAGPPACPSTEPPEGSSCPLEGQACGGFGRCSPVCTCTNHEWQCIAPPCMPPPPPPCPASPPGSQSCSGVGQQ